MVDLRPLRFLARLAFLASISSALLSTSGGGFGGSGGGGGGGKTTGFGIGGGGGGLGIFGGKKNEPMCKTPIIIWLQIKELCTFLAILIS